MQLIPLQAVPNQSLSLRLDNNLWDITIKEINGLMAADISLNNTVLVTGARICSGVPLLNYEYLETGNFTFITDNEEYPYYTQFGITQQLIYGSAAELSAARAS